MPKISPEDLIAQLDPEIVNIVNMPSHDRIIWLKQLGVAEARQLLSKVRPELTQLQDNSFIGERVEGFHFNDYISPRIKLGFELQAKIRTQQ